MEVEEQKNLYRDLIRVWARKWRWGYELSPSEKHIFDSHIKRGPVLSAACRIGRSFSYFERRSIEIIGLDSEPEILERAKERAHVAELVQGELTELDIIFPDSTFESVICLDNAYAGLFTDEERDSFLNGVKKTLQPGGKFLVDCIFSDSEGSQKYGTDFRVDNRYKEGGYGLAFKEKVDGQQVQCYQYFFSEAEFLKTLTDNGFKPVLHKIERQFELSIAICELG